MEQNAFPQPDIRSASMDDVDQVADILAEAFSNDPMMIWMFGNARPLRVIFLECAKGVYLRRGVGHITEDGAAALWLPVQAKLEMPLMGELYMFWAALRSDGFGALRRTQATEKVALASHPKEPHFYLFAVGVRDRLKGKGLGGRIIREGLKRADEAGAPAYLENSNPKNTPLYERLGFRATAPLGLPAGAPPLLGMLRQVGADR